MTTETTTSNRAGAPGAASGSAALEAVAGGASRRHRALRLGLLIVPIGAVLIVMSLVHLTQGTSHLTAAEVWAALTGSGAGTDGAGSGAGAGSAAADGAAVDSARAVIIDSRLPRLLAGLAVGAALGLAGAIMQSITRNSLASPDTLGVNAGAFFALTVVAAFGIELPFVSSAAVAFLGGLAAAACVLTVSSGPGATPIRMALAGSVIALGLAALTSMLLLFFQWQTQGLFAWGAGTLNQAGLSGVRTLTPLLVAGFLALLVFGRRLDALQLGEDAATTLGVRVRLWQLIFLSIGVLLTAVAVTLTGPIGFVGLCAPALTRLLVRFFPGLTRQRTLITVSALLGAVLVISADVSLRAIFGALTSVSIPTGVLTSLIGATFLAILAYTARSGFDADSLVTMRAGTRLGLGHPLLLITAAGLALACLAAASTLLGDTMLLGGDIVNWLAGQASTRIEIILEARVPRIAAAVLGGLSLALAGAILQGVTRNPLADPSVLGISAGAASGAVAVIITVGSSDFWFVLFGALAGAAAVGALLFGLSTRGGLDHARMVLAGISVSAGASALTTLMLVRADPWNQALAMTWLGGSTYGATFGQLIPMLIALAIAGLVLVLTARDLDLLQIDDTTPQLLGVEVSRTRAVLVGCALILVAAATVSIGSVAFLGLVAPHAARVLIGRSHRFLLPLAALLGALLFTLADAVGRTVVAPGQIPAGLITSVIGCPYFIWLLWRMRRS